MKSIFRSVVFVSAILAVTLLIIGEANAHSKSRKPKQRGYTLPSASGINNTIQSLFPGQDVNVKVLNNGYAVTGNVSDAEVASRIMQVVAQVSGRDESNIINLMQVTSGQQVMLRVRIGEVQRGSLNKLGLSAQGVKGAVTGLFYESKMFGLSNQLDLLERDGVMKILAEPNLVAISGETAKFLAGGEIPIPVMQKGDAITVDYKKFGVGVEFTPLVLSKNRTRLAVEPEVSEISGKGVVSTFGGIKIPAISSRKAKTTVELAPGESFIIAGLIKDDLRNVIDEVPVLGEIPILSSLFRSSAFKRNETELVIAVTPYLVNPVAAGDVKLPTDDFRPASHLENFFFGALGSLYGKNDVTSKIPGYGSSFGYITD